MENCMALSIESFNEPSASIPEEPGGWAASISGSTVDILSSNFFSSLYFNSGSCNHEIIYRMWKFDLIWKNGWVQAKKNFEDTKWAQLKKISYGKQCLSFSQEKASSPTGKKQDIIYFSTWSNIES